MSFRDVDPTKRIEEWWDWFAVALFLLITVDLITTIGATIEHGYAAEANPIVRWLLVQGPLALAAVNLAVVVVAVLCFRNVVRIARRIPGPYDRYFAFGVELWLGAIVSLGLFIFANNLSVIVWGSSLL